MDDETLIDEIESLWQAGIIQASIAEYAGMLRQLFPAEFAELPYGKATLNTMPRSDARVSVYCERAARGERLFNPLDLAPTEEYILHGAMWGNHQGANVIAWEIDDHVSA